MSTTPSGRISATYSPTRALVRPVGYPCPQLHTPSRTAMTPEQRARRLIDRQLAQAGWAVQSHAEMNISAAPGVAVREFPLKGGTADYLLYADGRAIGVVEAKPEGHTLTGVSTQSGKYLDGLPAILPNYRLPLPFAYESTGTVTRFTNALDAALLRKWLSPEVALLPKPPLTRKSVG